VGVLDTKALHSLLEKNDTGFFQSALRTLLSEKFLGSPPTTSDDDWPAEANRCCRRRGLVTAAGTEIYLVRFSSFSDALQSEASATATTAAATSTAATTATVASYSGQVSERTHCKGRQACVRRLLRHLDKREKFKTAGLDVVADCFLTGMHVYTYMNTYI
jgi:hypothetical protein